MHTHTDTDTSIDIDTFIGIDTFIDTDTLTVVNDAELNASCMEIDDSVKWLTD